MRRDRRTALRLLAAGGIASVSGLAGCGRPTSAAPVPGAAASDGSAADVIMIIRHAEKPSKDDPTGLTADGSPSDGSLTVRGWMRAGALAGLFAPVGQPVRAGLARPTVVYGARPHGDASQRPTQTVTPLAAKLGLPINSRYGKGDEASLADELRTRHGAILVSWQHEQIPSIVAHLGAVTPTAPSSWPDNRFDLVWVFQRAGTGWTFIQVPQVLLAGDTPTV
jgi:hypothetical protein